MALTLTIENETGLPDGGPLSVRITGKRGIDIGRDTHLDWTLPDPTRAISGKHCEVRYQDGGYWLYDVSTNGTFLDGQAGRLKGPHLLRHGERLLIGHYIIAVAVDNEPAARADESAPAQQVPYADLWNSTEDAAAPVDRSELRAPRERAAPTHPDFLDWAADVPDVLRERGSPARREPQRDMRPDLYDDLSWARGATKPVPVAEPPPPVPTPRRPGWTNGEPAARPPGPSGDDAAATRGEASPRSAASMEPEIQSVRSQAPVMPSSVDFVRHFADGAGLPAELLAQKRPEELAELMGVVLKIVTDGIRQLLSARLQAKRLAGSSTHTTIQALDNNPLKFSPTTEDALRIILGPPSRSYLDAPRAFEQGFEDLKIHQMKTFAAMQRALTMLTEDLDPRAIESKAGPDRGVSALIASRKAKLWDLYRTTWEAKTRDRKDGLIDTFMSYFIESYDKDDRVR